MTSSLISSQFITPYPQPALNGDLGLTSEDISSGLHIEAKHLRYKLRRSDFIENFRSFGFRVFPNVSGSVAIATFKLPRSYVFDVQAAKAFVATYESDLGRAYLVFLLQCERVVEIELPKLKEQFEAMKTALAHEKRPRKIRGEAAYKISRPIWVRDIFKHLIMDFVSETVPASQIELPEKIQWNIEHREKVIKGLSEATALDRAKQKGSLIVLKDD